MLAVEKQKRAEVDEAGEVRWRATLTDPSHRRWRIRSSSEEEDGRNQNVWVQPLMTKVVWFFEGTLKSVAKKTVQLVGSLLEDEETDDADKPVTIDQQKSQAYGNRRKKRGLNIQQLSVEEMTELDAMGKVVGL